MATVINEDLIQKSYLVDYPGGITVVGKTQVFRTIKERDRAVPSPAFAWVIDASGDDTVDSGSAFYAHTINGWKKLYETESMDRHVGDTVAISTNWSDLQGKPESDTNEIDEAVELKHSHANHAVLDKIGEVGSKLTFNGSFVSPDYSATFNQINDTLSSLNLTVDGNVQSIESLTLRIGDVENIISAAGGSGVLGDMKKSTYDTDNDGIVERADVADSVDWNNVTNKPEIPNKVIVDSELNINSNNAVRNSTVTQQLNEKANIDHNHDESYAASQHQHTQSDITGLSSALNSKSDVNHNHDDEYSSINHNHDGRYSLANHNHDTRYSLVTHDHDSDYASISHNHNGVYSKIGHTHDYSDVYSLKNHDHYSFDIVDLEDAINSAVSSKLPSPSNSGSAGDILVKTANGVEWATPAESVTVDSALSSTSENPVQNKVIKSALDGKSNTDHTHNNTYSELGHSHSIQDIANLESALNGKITNPSTGSSGDILKKTSSGVMWSTPTTVAVDSSLSTTSENPVQNKVIKTELDLKEDKGHTHTLSDITNLSSLQLEITSITGLRNELNEKIKNPATGSTGDILKKTANGAEWVTPTTITIDSSLSSTSENPVQNKVIKSALDTKSNEGHTHDFSDVYAEKIHQHATSDITNLISVINSTVSNKVDKPSNGNAGDVLTRKSDGTVEWKAPVAVDSSLSTTSENPVQNKVIKNALDTKSDTGHTHTISDISDMNNVQLSISNITGLQNSLDGKVNTISGKGLSTNDFSDDHKNALDSLMNFNPISNLIEGVAVNKGLSTNDFTNEYKNKLDEMIHIGSSCKIIDHKQFVMYIENNLYGINNSYCSIAGYKIYRGLQNSLTSEDGWEDLYTVEMYGNCKLIYKNQYDKIYYRIFLPAPIVTNASNTNNRNYPILRFSFSNDYSRSSTHRPGATMRTNILIGDASISYNTPDNGSHYFYDVYTGTQSDWEGVPTFDKWDTEDRTNHYYLHPNGLSVAPLQWTCIARLDYSNYIAYYQ